MTVAIQERCFRHVHTGSYDRRAIAAAPDLCFGEEHPALAHVQHYLRHYGYLTAAVAEGQLDQHTEQALIDFQRHFELSETGTLDQPTRSIMFASRCGLSDILREFGIGTMGGWQRRDLTYAFGRLTGGVPASVARAAVRRAFETWAAAGVGLSFTEVSSNPDIFVEWRDAADPDHSMVGGVIAHADYPPGFSIVVAAPPLPLHFDETEHAWRDGAVSNAFDIETVALHEIGHCLGLQHSQVVGDVMFPTVNPHTLTRTLTADSHARLHALYPPLSRWAMLDDNPETQSIVADGARLYQLHRSGSIFSYTGTPMTGWQELDNNPMTSALVASSGTLYQLHADGRLWKYTGTPMTGWQEVAHMPLITSVVATRRSLYVLQSDGRVFRYTGTPMTGWQELDNNPLAVRIVATDTELYQLHSSGDIWRYTGTPMTGWQQLDNNPLTVSITAAGNSLYQLHSSGHIYRYTGTPMSGWSELDNSPRAIAITAAGVNLYQLRSTGAISKHSPTPLAPIWEQLDNNPLTTAIAASGSRLYQLHLNGTIWRYTG